MRKSIKIKKQPPMTDRTTRMRFARVFDEESDIRDAYHTNCDYTLRMRPKLVQSVERQVQEWLDNKGIEHPQIEISFTDAKGNRCNEWLLFQRSEIALKTCSNNWDIYHIAESNFWPRIISSRPKLTIQHSSKNMLHMKNEIRSTRYSVDEEKECTLAERLLHNQTKEKVEEKTEGK